jgi:hypothetical protein
MPCWDRSADAAGAPDDVGPGGGPLFIIQAGHCIDGVKSRRIVPCPTRSDLASCVSELRIETPMHPLENPRQLQYYRLLPLEHCRKLLASASPRRF